jgi:hypothetical protein
LEEINDEGTEPGVFFPKTNDDIFPFCRALRKTWGWKSASGEEKSLLVYIRMIIALARKPAWGKERLFFLCSVEQYNGL